MCAVAEAVTIVAVGHNDFQQGHSHETMTDYLARVHAVKRSPSPAELRRQAHIAVVHIDIPDHFDTPELPRLVAGWIFRALTWHPC